MRSVIVFSTNWLVGFTMPLRTYQYATKSQEETQNVEDKYSQHYQVGFFKAIK